MDTLPIAAYLLSLALCREMPARTPRTADEILNDPGLRVLVARAKVTNRAGQRVRLPLDDATTRVTGAMLPRRAWRLDDDGQLIATFAASRILVIATTQRDEAVQAEGQASQSAQDSVDTQESTAD